MNLQLDPEIQKLLISTPSKLKGNYQHKDNFSISLAFPQNKDIMDHINSSRENFHSRNYFVFTLFHKFEWVNKVVNTDLEDCGEYICICLSVLFGKRFDYHGVLENFGNFHIPNFNNIEPIFNYKYYFNNHEVRKDLQIELELSNISKIGMLFEDGNEKSQNALNIFIAAGRFYLSALRIFETEPEIAYLNLITCGEILSNFHKYSDEELMNEKLQNLIQKECKEDREWILKNFQEYFSSIKRKFTLSTLKLLNNNFFDNHESKNPNFSLRLSDMEERLKAAYDIRSKYVHTGFRFGSDIKPEAGFNNAIQIGKPILEDKKLEKKLYLAPTFTGLERVMRYCLIRFLHLNICFIDEKLKN